MSQQGKPIHRRRMGSSEVRTLIIAGLDGDDQVAVRWMDNLALALERREDLLNQQEFVLLRAANPDGLTTRTRENSRGIDLNRNFPSRKYRIDSRERSGIGPASEVETRVVLQTLYEIRPRHTVHLLASDSPTLVTYNAGATEVANRLQASSTKLRLQQFRAEEGPGSLEDFIDSTLATSVMTLRLNAPGGPTASWNANATTVMTAIQSGNSQPLPLTKGAATEVAEELSSPAPEVTRPVKRNSGYEELPAPPK